MPAVAAVVLDIEGTTTPISFVRDRLFPLALDRLPRFIEVHARRPDVAAELDEVRRLGPGRDPAETLRGWALSDAKIAPLKSLQGAIWAELYQSGEVVAPIYDDVAPALRAWRAEGLDLAVYSSGSTAAQQLLFGYSSAGDLTDLFTRYFDLAVGPKREPASYRSIATSLGHAPEAIVFLSDVEAELDAAAASGWQTIQIVRPADGTVRSTRHRAASDFTAALAMTRL